MDSVKNDNFLSMFEMCDFPQWNAKEYNKYYVKWIQFILVHHDST